MNTSQLLHLVAELQKVSAELLDVSVTSKDREAGLRVAIANTQLCEINNVLTNHALENLKL